MIVFGPPNLEGKRKFLFLTPLHPMSAHPNTSSQPARYCRLSPSHFPLCLSVGVTREEKTHHTRLRPALTLSRTQEQQKHPQMRDSGVFFCQSSEDTSQGWDRPQNIWGCSCILSAHCVCWHSVLTATSLAQDGCWAPAITLTLNVSNLHLLAS